MCMSMALSGNTIIITDLCRYPQAGTDTNVTVIITNVGADFTSLGSFGSAEGFGSNLVSSMDRSFLLRKAINKDSVQARSCGCVLLASTACNNTLHAFP